MRAIIDDFGHAEQQKYREHFQKNSRQVLLGDVGHPKLCRCPSACRVSFYQVYTRENEVTACHSCLVWCWPNSWFFELQCCFPAETEPHEGKRRVEALWPIFKIHHQKSRYIYDLFYRRKAISRGKSACTSTQKPTLESCLSSQLSFM